MGFADSRRGRQTIKQISFSEVGFAAKKWVTRRERFLAKRETVIPCQGVLGVIEPQCPDGSRHRPLAAPDRRRRRRYLIQRHVPCAERLQKEATDIMGVSSVIGPYLAQAAPAPTSGRGSSLASPSKNTTPATASHAPSPPVCLLPAEQSYCPIISVAHSGDSCLIQIKQPRANGM